KIMVRLVKGAYWDTEIKRAQVEGLSGFPVFTKKSATDVSYICCAKKLLSKVDRIYPQFATHNAHSISAVLKLASDFSSFEFQRLHGMGEALHRQILDKHGTNCRIYAPVGAHRDLLAYLVRRLLENGANSSFVNQIVDETVPAALIASDPFNVMESYKPNVADNTILWPRALYGKSRENSHGWDLHCHADVDEIEAARTPFKSSQWHAIPLMAVPFRGDAPKVITNPANPDDIVGDVVQATAEDTDAALAAAQNWGDNSPQQRAAILLKAADLYEKNFGEFFAALCREAGKTPMDCVAELREAVDFLRYYATQAPLAPQHGEPSLTACISPWNFPLAIFTGQIAAALAAGNGVLAKPADPTPIVAHIAVKLLLEAGVPDTVLQLLPGRGSSVGAKLIADPRVGGVCFTGSTKTAQMIHSAMADTVHPAAPLIAETGGLNAMIVDSTALPEQAVKDIIASSFQSAGQRCSALRLLYLQEDVAPAFLEMLYGAVDELNQGDPWDFNRDLGPVINEGAQSEINEYIEQARTEGRLLKQVNAPDGGIYVAPTIIKVSGIADMQREIFGPVLHIATFKSTQIKKIVADINASGYGLTFGLHTRIDDRVEYLTSELNVGNMYVNRNQIGAIVGSQPFGGEGLSGTGPKAGGPHYVARFVQPDLVNSQTPNVPIANPLEVQRALDQIVPPSRQALSTKDLPGPTGESNRLSVYPRGTVLCLGPTREDALAQAKIAQSQGCKTLIVAADVSGNGSIAGHLERLELETLSGFDVVALWSDEADLRQARKALAARKGAIIPLACSKEMASYCVMERHVCVDTTAAGGNASLLAAVG
ncbi:MAG: bifunctional proline dehydrogenase/L-glutamate gamma-semialdehyde dehydrogenase PutA, partial [Pseudomonadota bacterium]